MVLFQLILFVLLGISMATMFSGFMLARRMGMFLMMQVMMLMFFMFVSIGILLIGIFLPPSAPAIFDLMHILILADFILVLIAALMQFGQVLPIILKTMQGGPFHSSHMTNLLVSLFFTLALVIYYVDLAVL